MISDDDKDKQIDYLRQKVADLEKCLFESEDKFRSVADSAPVGLFLDDAAGNAIYINRKCAELVGVPPEDALSFNWIPYLHPDDKDMMVSEWEKAFSTGSEFHLEYRWIHSDGKIVWTLGEVIPIKDESGNVKLFIGALTDVTKRKEAELEKEKLQVQLGQAQKMECIGRLAGGIAHDYNNMLNAILGYSELAMNEVESNGKAHGMLEEIHKAAKRSADITRQLLSFARKQVITPKVFDINDAIKEIHNMLNRLIADNVAIDLNLYNRPVDIKMDPVQFDQLVVNLCINARDAIAGDGKITINTSVKSFNEEHCRKDARYSPGDFVLLSIADDGCGMDDITLENIFEPFFTTKGENKGTGLGLASVYGTVQQNNGFIIVESKPNIGSTFSIYIPLAANEPKKSIKKTKISELSNGAGVTILVVEDEPAILSIVKLVLETYNYTVLVASNADKAIKFSRSTSKIDLLLTDVIMPDINGRVLAVKLRREHPEMRCLYMSGYTADILAEHSLRDENFEFIQKPFTTKDLVAKVQSVLGVK